MAVKNYIFGKPSYCTRTFCEVPGLDTKATEHHAMLIGPYWFNCATEADDWHDCSVTGTPRAPR